MPEPAPIVTVERAPNFEENEGTDEAVVAASTVVTAINQGRVDFASDIRGQVEFLRYIRNKRSYVAESPVATRGMHLVWRLVIASSVAAGITSIGAFMTVVAMLDRPLDPNPFLALLLFLAGAVLTATVVAIVRGDDR